MKELTKMQIVQRARIIKENGFDTWEEWVKFRDKRRKEAVKGYNKTAYQKYKNLSSLEKSRIREVENIKRNQRMKDNPELHEKKKASAKLYYQKNKEKLREYARNYKKIALKKNFKSEEEKKADRKKWNKKYYEANREKCLKNSENFRNNNKEKCSLYMKEYYKANKEKFDVR